MNQLLSKAEQQEGRPGGSEIRIASQSWVVRRLKNPWLSVLDGLLAALVVCFVLLHTWGWGGHLNWQVDPISTFTSSAPGKSFGSSSMILLGAIYIVLAGGLLRRLGRSRAVIVSGVLLVLAGGFLFFVARYPTYFKPASTPRQTFWEWASGKVFPPSGDKIAKEERERVIAAAHDDMILTSTACFIASQSVLVGAFWRNRRRRHLAIVTALLLGPTVILFYGAFNWYSHAGLYQRAGFVSVFTWIIFVGRRFFTPAAVK